jgi:hypothetical protein
VLIVWIQLELRLGFDAVYAKAKIERYAGPRLACLKISNKDRHLKVMSGALAGTPVSCMNWIKTTVGA